MAFDWSPTASKHFQAWSIVRITGRLPLSVFGAGDIPRQLDTCPGCSAADVDVRHILHTCPSTEGFFAEWVVTVGRVGDARNGLSWDRLQWELFAPASCQASVPYTAAHIKYVGVAFEETATAIIDAQNEASISEYTMNAEATVTGLLANRP